VAIPTLANPPRSHQLFAESLRLFAPTARPKPQPAFLVFPTGGTEYRWRIIYLATNRTNPRHKRLTRGRRKCTWLNEHRGKTQLDPPKVALSVFPNSDRANCQGVGNEAN
jgi:hypothetical protein